MSGRKGGAHFDAQWFWLKTSQPLLSQFAEEELNVNWNFWPMAVLVLYISCTLYNKTIIFHIQPCSSKLNTSEPEGEWLLLSPFALTVSDIHSVRHKVRTGSHLLKIHSTTLPSTPDTILKLLLYFWNTQLSSSSEWIATIRAGNTIVIMILMPYVTLLDLTLGIDVTGGECARANQMVSILKPLPANKRQIRPAKFCDFKAENITQALWSGEQTKCLWNKMSTRERERERVTQAKVDMTQWKLLPTLSTPALKM